MKAVRFSEFGLPENVVTVVDVPTPEPAADEIVVRMQARPINPSDLYQIMGVYGVKPKLPATPGLEGAGVVEKIGAEVKTLRPGQKIVPLKPAAGTWQECVVVKENQVFPVPDAMDIEAAAMMLANPFSAFLMTREVMKVGAGEWLLQDASGSALGLMVIALGKIYGFKTINVVRRREQVAELKARGADEVICSADEDIVSRVMEITGGKGVPYAIDAVAGQVGGALANALGVGGVLLVYGALDQADIAVSPGTLIFKEIAVKGFWVTRWFATASEERKRAVFGELLPLIMDGKIVSEVAARYSLDDAVAAVTHAQKVARGGKILLIG
jgi:NADPH:quinone reductase-like Zn-dependent oxidoreductase